MMGRVWSRLRRLANMSRRDQELALLSSAGRALGSTLDLDRVLVVVLEEARRLLDVVACSVWLVEPDGEMVCRQATGPQSELVRGWRLAPGKGIAGWVARSGRSLIVPDAPADDRHFEGVDRRTGLASRSILSVPLTSKNKVIGVLQVVDTRLNRFTADDLRLMESLAAPAAIAVEHARLYERAQQEIAERARTEREILRRNRELALLNRVSAAAAASLRPESILETVCREMALAFDLPQASACLLNEEKTERTIIAGYLAEGRASLLDDTLAVKDSPVVQYLITRKAPLIANDAQHDPRLASAHDLLRRKGVCSLLAMPLIVGEDVTGCLALVAVEPHDFSTEEVNLAWSVTDQVAGVLARARLFQDRQRLAAAIDQTAEGVMVTDTGGTILYVNPAFERITGYSRSEAVGQHTRFLRSGQQDAAVYEELWTTIAIGQVWHGRLVNKRKDGTLCTVDTTISPVRNENGTIANYVAIQRDVTRELQLEAQYLQAQKMEAVGRLTAGIAHDFNNLLTAINGFAELTRLQLLPDDPLHEMVEKILQSGQRAADLVRQLLAFSRKQIIQPQVLSLNTVVANMDKLLQRVIGEDIELETRLASDLWAVKVDPTQIEQVVANLAVNARDAMPGGGRLTIQTANIVLAQSSQGKGDVTLDEAYAAHHLEVEPGEYVLLTVSDTGVGMSEEVKAHLFEPFFTTKGLGKGTGLGLATVHGIVKQSGGHIGVYSEEGQPAPAARPALACQPGQAGASQDGPPRGPGGAVFRIYLPRHRGDIPREAAVLRERVDLPGGDETILLVEDDERVRDLARHILQDRGYTVLEARDGQEALAVSAAHPGPIHLLLTDIVMPGMSGRVVAERLSQTRPGLKVLFTSGYTDDETILRHGVPLTDVALLQKPFGAAALTGKVRQVLDEGGPKNPLKTPCILWPSNPVHGRSGEGAPKNPLKIL